MLPILRGVRVRLRPLERADRPTIRVILAEPEIARWWGLGDADQAVHGWFEDLETTFAIELEGTVVDGSVV